jgi:hypothetical protein
LILSLEKAFYEIVELIDVNALRPFLHQTASVKEQHRGRSPHAIIQGGGKIADHICAAEMKTLRKVVAKLVKKTGHGLATASSVGVKLRNDRSRFLLNGFFKHAVTQFFRSPREAN